jgi:hypothetical protein
MHNRPAGWRNRSVQGDRIVLPQLSDSWDSIARTRALFIQDVSELKVALVDQIERDENWIYFNSDYHIDDIVEWIIQRELERIHLFVSDNQLPVTNALMEVYDRVQNRCTCLSLSRLVSGFVEVPKVYNNAKPNRVSLEGMDLYIWYYYA